MLSTAPPTLPYYPSRVLWLFLVPAIGGFLFGYDIGGTSFVVVELAGLPASEALSLRDAPLKTGWIVSAPSAGALLGTALLACLERAGESRQRKEPRRTHPRGLCRERDKSGRDFPLCSSRGPIGRRTELVWAGILYGLGALLQWWAAKLGGGPDSNNPWSVSTVSSSLSSSSSSHLPLVVLSLGRWIYGAGIGFAMHGGPTYLAETVPARIRGVVVGGKEIAIVLGILGGYAGGWAWTRDSDSNGDSNGDDWARVYGFAIPLAVAMILLSSTIPESARYIVSSSCSSGCTGTGVDTSRNESPTEEETRLVSARVSESLHFVWTPKAARDEHRRLIELFHRNHRRGGDCDDPSRPRQRNDALPAPVSLWDPSVRPALTAGLGLVVLQQITGQPSVLSYATPILARVPGLTASASVVLALFKVLATSVSVVLVETRGRRTLLIVGCSLMLAALLVLTAAFGGDERHDENVDENSDMDMDNTAHPLDTRGVLAVLGMFAYIAGYQIGFGPITWLVISEVFPQSVRGRAVALAVQTNFLLNALVQLVVPLLIGTLGLSRTFWVFGGLTAGAVIFVRSCVPETKGLTLEEIEERFLALALVRTTGATAAAAAAVAGEEEEAEEESFQLGEHRRLPPNEDYGSNHGNDDAIGGVGTFSIVRSDGADNEETVRLLSTTTAGV